MRSRCYSKSNINYKNYGGRGIKVCEEWNDSKYGFIAFYAWAIKAGFMPSLSIERHNNDGNYCPENCTWEPPWKQAQNTRKTIKIWDSNEYISLKAYCTRHKDTLNYDVILNHIHDGIPPYIALYYDIGCMHSLTWIEKHEKNLELIMYNILCDHPNLIENFDIPLLTYIKEYLARY